MTKHSYAAKAFSLLLALVLTLSLAVNSAAAVSFQDMNPKDDALLGTKFNVDATITLVTGKEGKDVSLSIPVSGMSRDALAAAITAGTVTLALERDDSRPYVNEELFPYAYAGGDLNSWMIEGKDEHQFTDIKLTANEKNGKAVLDVSFHVNNYFYSTNRRTGETTPDYSVPHVNGSYYIDLCGYFDLTAKNSGSAPHLSRSRRMRTSTLCGRSTRSSTRSRRTVRRTACMWKDSPWASPPRGAICPI